MSIAGAPLVNALIRAAAHYAAGGRPCFLQRQEHTPGRTVAHADMVGGVDGRALALEAKMTAGDYFQLYPARAAQRAALSELLRRGARVALVVEFVDHDEIYGVAWAEVEIFLRAAWRRSLSITWFRAYGRLIPQLQAGDERKRCALWLDAAEHPNRPVAFRAIELERTGKPTFPVDGDDERDAKLDARVSPKQLALRARLAASPKPGSEEYRAHLRGVVSESIGRQLGGAGRARKPRWKGGRG